MKYGLLEFLLTRNTCSTAVPPAVDFYGPFFRMDTCWNGLNFGYFNF